MEVQLLSQLTNVKDNRCESSFNQTSMVGHHLQEHISYILFHNGKLNLNVMASVQAENLLCLLDLVLADLGFPSQSAVTLASSGTDYAIQGTLKICDSVANVWQLLPWRHLKQLLLFVFLFFVTLFVPIGSRWL